MGNHKLENEVTAIASISVKDVGNMLLNSTQIFPVAAGQMANHTPRDPILRQLASYIQRGWPPRITFHEIKQYYQRHKS